MAHIRFAGGGEKEVPDEATLTDYGIEWFDEDGARHVVPWSAVVEFIGPPGSEPEPPASLRM
ncbi:MAG: hypothetical protein ACRDHS_14190 [Actinomycetota bacterium]